MRTESSNIPACVQQRMQNDTEIHSLSKNVYVTCDMSTLIKLWAVHVRSWYQSKHYCLRPKDSLLCCYLCRTLHLSSHFQNKCPCLSKITLTIWLYGGLEQKTHSLPLKHTPIHTHYMLVCISGLFC